MDALLIGFLGCLLGEIGDGSQRLVLALAKRFDRNRPIIAGVVVAAFANALLGAAAGAFLSPMLGSSARLLFLALALLFLGAGMLWPVKPPDPLSTWPTGPFLTSALGLFILGFGGGAQFLILGLAARTADPAMAALGGAMGVVAALAPAALLRDQLMARVPLRAIRLTGGLILLLISLTMGIGALGLA